MRINDWSADVCASDLDGGAAAGRILRDLLDHTEAVDRKKPDIFVMGEARVIEGFSRELAHRHAGKMAGREHQHRAGRRQTGEDRKHRALVVRVEMEEAVPGDNAAEGPAGDRKSTRLNSSH